MGDDTQVDIPQKGDFPTEQKNTPLGVPNWADNAETVDKFLTRARMHLQKHDAQTARNKFETDARYADQMFRMSASQTKQTENVTRDEVDSIPGVYRRTTLSVAATIGDMLFKPGTPVRYEPYVSADPIAQQSAASECRQRNLLYEYSLEADNRVPRIKASLIALMKYGNRFYSKSWYSEKRTFKSRVKGESKTLKFQYPTLIERPMEQCWFDANIDDIQQQQSLELRFFPTLTQLGEGQEKGEYINVKEIGDKQLYREESPSRVKGDRQADAGDGDDTSSVTGEIDAWEVPMRAPIDDNGVWDEDKNMPRWCCAIIAGNLFNQSNDGLVCLSLTKNVYGDGTEIPHQIVHAQWDDKGAFHDGFPQTLRPAYREIKTTMDQWFDNKNLINAAPMLTERGAIITDDKAFGPRRLFEMKQGMIEKFKRLIIPSNTNDQLAFLSWQESALERDTFTTKAFRGEEQGARTSASEARNNLERTLTPTAEQTRYIGEQLLVFDAKWDAVMWQQFADADLILTITGETEPIQPATLGGPFRCKLSAVDEFIADTVSRLEWDKALQVSGGFFMPLLDKDQALTMFRWMMTSRNIMPPDIASVVFSAPKTTDALMVARSENEDFKEGTWNPAEAGENHSVHLSIHNELAIPLKRLPPDQRPEGVLELVEQHIVQTQQLQQQEQAGVAQGAAQQQAQNEQVAEPTGLPQAGEQLSPGGEAQNLLGAEGGELGQAF